MYKLNSRGPRTNPWGTPNISSYHELNDDLHGVLQWEDRDLKYQKL